MYPFTRLLLFYHTVNRPAHQPMSMALGCASCLLFKFQPTTRQPYLPALTSVIASAPFGTSKIRILVAPSHLPGYRGQLVHGLLYTKGDIIIKADSHIAIPPTHLTDVLPCFEDDNVGVAGGAMKVAWHANMTPWEVASAKIMFGRGRTTNLSVFATDKFRCGGVVAYRASVVVRDPEFIERFIDDI
ncbi:hypothetical protein OQA88_5110 [Cercophora sp. LCS_1]